VAIKIQFLLWNEGDKKREWVGLVRLTGMEMVKCYKIVMVSKN
jgi:hypothetical protein